MRAVAYTSAAYSDATGVNRGRLGNRGRLVASFLLTIAYFSMIKIIAKIN